jgi:Tol biopolymer transport system component
MTITAGTKLGSYEITAAIGAGGMGEVYEARDTKLGRNVAIKVLPEAFAYDPERLARFQREAKMLASLNHPNIATIYGLEQSNGVHFLIMELVLGETLAERINREGALAVEEALAVCQQIAEALEAAHERGIIHRDLKPANVKLTLEGKVKVLDFGLAKAFAEDSQTSDPTNSPTLSMAATMHGVILGTAAYMSPEQARGKAVDKRTDIWAFGCVLYELVTGKQAFAGDDITDILAAVVRAKPDWQALPVATPVKIRDLLRRCLQKDKTLRLQAAGDARIEIQEALTAPARAEPVAARRKSRERLGWSVAAVLLVVALALGAFPYLRRSPEDASPVRFFVYPPDGWRLAGTETIGVPLAVSPDGRRLAFVGTNTSGKSLLWVRSLDALTAQALTGTDGALSPFWSPDSRFLGFFAGGKLKKIELSDGPPITLCDAADNVGGAWSRDGLIVFAQYHGFARFKPALQKVSASGGAPTPATVLAEGETTQLLPFFLPDGRHFLYRSNDVTTGIRPIYLASLDSAERKLLLNGDSPNVLYTQGHLLFLRDTMLMAQPFDVRRLVLTGDAFPIVEQIQIQGGISSGVFSASDNGVLAYQTGTGTATVSSQLVWFDRSGKQVGMLGDAAAYSDLEFSPDAKRASVSIPEAGKGRDIWLYDITRGLRTRFTFDPADELESIWSPDGSQIVFNSGRKGHLDLYQKASSGAGTEEVLVEDGLDKYPLSWSPDGRFILYADRTNNNLFVLPFSGDRKPFPFLKTQFNGVSAQFSPDGRWVAYQSNDPGRAEVYVAPFPGPGGPRQISTAGGSLPRWRRDGAEIFYLDPDNNLMAAAVNGKGGSFDVGAVKLLFGTHAAQGGRYRYGASADGQRFLINTLPEQTASAPITVVLNWTAGLKR